MGHTARESHTIRVNRRSRSAVISKGILETHLGHLSPDPDRKSDPNCDDNGWGYCSEEQLEEILLRNLEVLYNEAVSKIVALGYDEDVALRAVLKNGHCYGGMDVLTNILHNSLAYLSSNRGNSSGSSSGCGGNEEEEEEESGENGPVFNDLRQIVEYSLACMVHLLRQFRPHLSKGDALWCLLMSDLHVGRASSMEIPVVLGDNGCDSSGNVVVPNALASLESVSGSAMGVMAPMLCRFHSGWGFGDGGNEEFPVNGFYSYSADVNMQRDIECSRRFNLSPSMRSLLKRNVAAFAAGFRASHRKLQNQLQQRDSIPANGNGQPGLLPEVSAVHHHEESQVMQKQGEVDSVFNQFCDLSLDEKIDSVTDEEKDEMLVTLLQQINELEEQVKERKEWAHQKAMQAARKLSNDLNELKFLRVEREDNQKLKKGKQMIEDTTLKRLSEMEHALRKASGQVDRANAAVRRIEIENAEIRAEMVASMLSASESARARMEVTKREKKFLKRILAWEKQKTKLQEEIGGEKEKILKLQQDLAQIKQSQKDIEVKWMHELKAKELASAQVQEEQQLKEAAEANSKRKLEALQLKIEIDFQRHKDDLQRLEQELSRLKASAQVTCPPSNVLVRGPEGPNSQNKALTVLLNGLGKTEDSLDKECNSDRECIICRKDEVSVVFLPCAHQVLCTKCNDNYGKKGKSTCPSCRVPVKQRIRVWGANS